MPQIKIERAWWRPAAVISSAAVAFALTAVPAAALADEVGSQPSDELTKQEQVVSGDQGDSTLTSSPSTPSSTPVNNEGGSSDLVGGVNGGTSGGSSSSETVTKPGNTSTENGGSTPEGGSGSSSLPDNGNTNEGALPGNESSGNAGTTEKNDGDAVVGDTEADGGNVVDEEGTGVKDESSSVDSVTNSVPSANNSLTPPATADSQGPADEVVESNKTVDDGIYAIGSSLDSTKVIDVPAGNATNQQSVQIFDGNGSDAQKWEIKWHVIDGDYGYYTIGLAGTNKVLDVEAGNAYDGATVWLFDYNGTDAQRWSIKKNDAGFWSIFSFLGNYCLDIEGAGTANGTKIWLFSSNNSPAQSFSLMEYHPSMPGELYELPEGDGVYIIHAAGDKSGNMVLDVNGASFDNSANVQIFTNNGSVAQRFYFERDEKDGFYTITNLGSGKVLDLAGGGIVPSTNVQQFDSNQTDAQKWAIIKTKRQDGSEAFFIINKLTGLALDIEAAQFSNGSNVWGYTHNSTDAQLWYFTPSKFIEKDVIYSIHSGLSSNKVVDVDGASSLTGAKIQIFNSNNTLAQRFDIELVGDGDNEFRIRTASSSGWLTVVGSNVVQSNESVDSSANTWKAIWKDGFFALIGGLNDSTSECYALTVTQSGSLGIRWIDLNVDKLGSAEHFIFRPAQLISDGYYEIASEVGSNLVLDVTGGVFANESNVEIFDRNSTNAQKFYISWDGSGYVITAARTDFALDASSESNVNGINVRLNEKDGSLAQRWIAKIADGGGIIFINAQFSNRVLDVEGSSAVAGTNVQLFDENGSKAQRWRLFSTTIPYGWVQSGNTWQYYDRNGNMLTDSIVAYNLYQQIKNQYSDTNYLIAVDAEKCHVVLFQGSAGNWELVFDALAGTGDPYLASTDTDGYGVTGEGGNPWGSLRGYFKLGSTTTGYTDSNGRREYDSADQLKWFRSIYMDYGFHSTCGNYSDPSQVGKRISHGCIRLLEQYAKMIYDLPKYTMVAVLPSYKGSFQVDQR